MIKKWMTGTVLAAAVTAFGAFSAMAGETAVGLGDADESPRH